MADFKSHSRVENELVHHFRERLSHAESAEDARKFFIYTIQELLRRVLGESTPVRYEDVALEGAAGYRVSARLAAQPAWQRALADSDLGAIIGRFAETAGHRVRHLEGNSERPLPRNRSRAGNK
jgi:hypothetical protein